MDQTEQPPVKKFILKFGLFQPNSENSVGNFEFQSKWTKSRVSAKSLKKKKEIRKENDSCGKVEGGGLG